MNFIAQTKKKLILENYSLALLKQMRSFFKQQDNTF